MLTTKDLFEDWIVKNDLRYSCKMKIITGDNFQYSCELQVDGIDHIGYGHSSSEEGALNEAIINYVEYIYQIGSILADAVPRENAGDSSKHGNWTTENAKSRLNIFLQANKINADYHYTVVKSEPTTQFMAEMTIDIPQIGTAITGREMGSSKQIASKKCALSIVSQLFLRGLIEPFSDNMTKLRIFSKLIQKLAEQLKKLDIPVEPNRSGSVVECSTTLDSDEKINLVETMISLTSLPSHQLTLALNLISQVVELGQNGHLNDSIGLGIINSPD